jgi:hypothetical protein
VRPPRPVRWLSGAQTQQRPAFLDPKPPGRSPASAWSPRRVPAPGEGAGSLLRPPSGHAACQWRLSSGACSTRGRVLDRALPEVTDSRNGPLGSHQHPRRWLPLSDTPCTLQRVRRARARSKLRHWTNARHRPIGNCSSVKLENNTRKVLTGHCPPGAQRYEFNRGRRTVPRTLRLTQSVDEAALKMALLIGPCQYARNSRQAFRGGLSGTAPGPQRAQSRTTTQRARTLGVPAGSGHIGNLHSTAPVLLGVLPALRIHADDPERRALPPILGQAPGTRRDLLGPLPSPMQPTTARQQPRDAP